MAFCYPDPLGWFLYFILFYAFLMPASSPFSCILWIVYPLVEARAGLFCPQPRTLMDIPLASSHPCPIPGAGGNSFLLSTPTLICLSIPESLHSFFPCIPIIFVSILSSHERVQLLDVYGVNCVLPKFIHWSPNPQYLRKCVYLEMRSLKRWLK